MEVLLATVAVAFATTVVTIGHQRLGHWLTWAPAITVCALAADVILCFLLGSAAAATMAHYGWLPMGDGFLGGAVVATAANGASVARLPGRGSPADGATGPDGLDRRAADALAFGLAAFCHELASKAVQRRIGGWVQVLSDCDLLDWCTRLDATRTGTKSAERVRREWRRRTAGELDGDGQSRREARAALENALIEAIRKAMWWRPKGAS